MNLDVISKQLNSAVKEAGAFILKQREGFGEEKVSSKSLNQLVSYVDKEAEQMLVSTLRTIVPEAGFLTEEQTTDQAEQKLMWIIDPLDGTTNFIHGLPVYSVSVALADGSDLLCGAVYEINHDELFHATKGRGAWLNGKPIKVAQATSLEKTLMATGFPYYDFEQLEEYIQVLKELMRVTRGLRRMGSAAVDLAYVACGRFDGFFELKLHAWDVAAGVLIVQEAGGRVVDFKGGNDFIHGGQIIASSSAIFPELIRVIQNEFGA